MSTEEPYKSFSSLSLPLSLSLSRLLSLLVMPSVIEDRSNKQQAVQSKQRMVETFETTTEI